jgi:hypothetical protein
VLCADVVGMDQTPHTPCWVGPLFLSPLFYLFSFLFFLFHFPKAEFFNIRIFYNPKLFHFLKNWNFQKKNMLKFRTLLGMYILKISNHFFQNLNGFWIWTYF